MANYEVGVERQKVTKKIMSTMVVRSNFDEAVLDAISKPLTSESVRLLFKLFLRMTNEKERNR